MSEENQNKKEPICLNCHFFFERFENKVDNEVSESHRNHLKKISEFKNSEISQNLENEEKKGMITIEDADKHTENKRAQEGLAEYFLHNYYFYCYKGEWDEMRNPELKQTRTENIIRTDRQNCYFYPYKKERNVEAAIKLQKEKIELEKINDARKFQQNESEKNRIFETEKWEDDKKVKTRSIVITFILAMISINLHIIDKVSHSTIFTLILIIFSLLIIYGFWKFISSGQLPSKKKIK